MSVATTRYRHRMDALAKLRGIPASEGSEKARRLSEEIAESRATVTIRNRFTNKVVVELEGRPGESETAILHRIVKKCIASDDPKDRDWSGADVRGLDFTGLNMEGMIFDDALITGAKFDKVRGTNMSFLRAIALPEGSSSDKKVQKTSFRGFRSKGGTKFCAMQAADIDFSESVMHCASFRGASLHRMIARNVRWRRNILTHTDQVDCDYSHKTVDGRHLNSSLVVDCDWGNSFNVRPNFCGTDVTDSLRDDINLQMAKVHAKDIARLSEGGARLSRDRRNHFSARYKPVLEGELSNEGRMEAYQHLAKRFPDKYRSSVFIGVKSDKHTKRTKMATWDSRFMTFKATAMGGLGFVAWTALQMMCANPLDAMLAAYGLGLVPGGMMLTQMVGTDASKDFFKKHMIDPTWGRFNTFVENSYINIMRRLVPVLQSAAGKVRLAITCGLQRDMGPLVRALSVTAKKGPLKKSAALFCHFFKSGDLRIVVCDADHLAAAMGHLSANRQRGYRLPRDLTLVRMPATGNTKKELDEARHWEEKYPATVTFEKEGNTMLSWVKDGESSHVATYDKDGNLAWQADLRTGCWVSVEKEGLLPYVQLKLHGDDDSTPGPRREEDLLKRFSDLITEDAGQDTLVVPKGCYVRAGEDGTLHVMSEETHLHNNPEGAAIIARDKSANIKKGQSPWMIENYMLDGVLVTGEEFDILTEGEEVEERRWIPDTHHDIEGQREDIPDDYVPLEFRGP